MGGLLFICIVVGLQGRFFYYHMNIPLLNVYKNITGVLSDKVIPMNVCAEHPGLVLNKTSQPSSRLSTLLVVVLFFPSSFPSSCPFAPPRTCHIDLSCHIHLHTTREHIRAMLPSHHVSILLHQNSMATLPLIGANVQFC